MYYESITTRCAAHLLTIVQLLFCGEHTQSRRSQASPGVSQWQTHVATVFFLVQFYVFRHVKLRIKTKKEKAESELSNKVNSQ